ncbi:CDGSH iron-sulfur domain-containing protein [Synechococcus sp. CS-205]|uniref:CDGSH iron-sulfur domain-containing protein n=1 Tax=Synechococcus sp. CS-205 TaxID=2847984 RepID=UPI002A4DFA21|nr:CDGSH iron-sulfur domain-containing protein [Synechococcus sp. CS-205]
MAEPAPSPAGPIPLELPAGVHQLCGCGHSHRYPLCDGSHARPPRRPRWGGWGRAARSSGPLPLS